MRKLFFASVLSIVLFSCAQKLPQCKGPAKADCICTMQYDPVCGCDNKTYGNACQAGCAGVTRWSKGECK